MNPKYASLIIGFIFLVAFSGCRSSEKLADGHPITQPAADSKNVNYTLIYIIHGDANYLYHNQSGESLQADEEQVKEAVEIAQKAKQGEVFIFHQQPESKVLWLFPRKDRQFLHYRNGQTIHETSYSPQSEKNVFAKEQALYEKYRVRGDTRTFFLYFGHEIPENKGTAYFKSQPEVELTTSTFTGGESSFLDTGQRFDLTVLSTCDNGTPAMVSKQESLTDYLLASPQNLHLSHVDSQGLLRLEKDPDISSEKIAQNIAQDTFNRLNSFLQTVITLSVYDMDQMGALLSEASEKYQRYKQTKSRHQFEIENRDCALLEFWDLAEEFQGVTTYYKAPAFGRHSSQKSHSGWGCQP